MRGCHAAPLRLLPVLLLGGLGAAAAQDVVENRRALREKVRELFTHAYDNYMEHAFPQDVVLPLSCRGADEWGGMALTLLDTLDMLALMGNATEFERGVRYCVDHLSFDRDETVSVFETNIRGALRRGPPRAFVRAHFWCAADRTRSRRRVNSRRAARSRAQR